MAVAKAASDMFAIILSLFFSIRSGLRARDRAPRGGRRPSPSAPGPSAGQSRSKAPVDCLRQAPLSLALTIVDGWRSALVIVKPETLMAWHRPGFRLYWSWKCRHRHLPSISRELIDLIREMSLANPRWGAPRIHAELSKLGFVSEATVAKYMAHPRKPPSQTWRTFLANHRKDIVSSDFFVVPTVVFGCCSPS
jgi:helix-turn-helix protein